MSHNSTIVSLAAVFPLMIVVAGDLHAQLPSSQAHRSQARPTYDMRVAEHRKLQDQADAADDAIVMAQPVVVAPLDLTLTADLGISSYPATRANDGGLVFGATALTRFKSVGAGVFVQGESNFAQRSSATGIAAGLSTQTVDGFRLDILGTFNLHHYASWGGTFGMDTNKPGAAATLPCAGGRLRALYSFHRHYRGHFVLGLQIGFDQDLKHEFVQYQYAGGLTDQQSVGGARFTLGLVIGGAIDFGRQRRTR